eukprot:1516184-Amphidinium_carterae.2
MLALVIPSSRKLSTNDVRPAMGKGVLHPDNNSARTTRDASPTCSSVRGYSETYKPPHGLDNHQHMLHNWTTLTSRRSSRLKTMKTRTKITNEAIHGQCSGAT